MAKANQLKQDKRNYRKHSGRNKELIRKSIDEAGFGRSVVVDADDVQVCGNGVQSVIDPETPTRIIETDGTELVVVKRTDLHEGDERRNKLAMADNATADHVEWDMDILTQDFDFEEIGDFDIELGFEYKEQDRSEEATEEDDFDEQKDSVPTVCQPGDLWVLGEHRLLCGDSTKVESYERLLGEEKPQLIVTDPPYLISNINAGGKDGLGITKSLSGLHTSENFDITKSWNIEVGLEIVKKLQGNEINVYFWCNKLQVPEYFKHFVESEKCKFDIICWHKTNTLPTYSNKYLSDTEYCLYFHKGSGKTHPQSYEHARTFFVEPVNSEDKKEWEHPTIKPQKVLVPSICNSSAEHDLVLDCFGGSGSTLIACEQLNRKARLMELDPHYCDVIIARWEKLTGKKAVKTSDKSE